MNARILAVVILVVLFVMFIVVSSMYGQEESAEPSDRQALAAAANLERAKHIAESGDEQHIREPPPPTAPDDVAQDLPRLSWTSRANVSERGRWSEANFGLTAQRWRDSSASWIWHDYAPPEDEALGAPVWFAFSATLPPVSRDTVHTIAIASTGMSIVIPPGERAGVPVGHEATVLGDGVTVAGCSGVMSAVPVFATGGPVDRPYTLRFTVSPESDGKIVILSRSFVQNRDSGLIASVETPSGGVVLRSDTSSWTVAAARAHPSMTLAAAGASSRARGSMPLCSVGFSVCHPSNTFPSVLRDGQCPAFSDSFRHSTRACDLPQCESADSLSLASDAEGEGSDHNLEVVILHVRQHVNNLNGATSSVSLRDALDHDVLRFDIQGQRCDTEKLFAARLPEGRVDETLTLHSEGVSGFTVSSPVVQIMRVTIPAQ